jgi:hypothetical protein
MARLGTSIAPDVDRYCGLFATVGERRLETHLIGGLLVWDGYAALTMRLTATAASMKCYFGAVRFTRLLNTGAGGQGVARRRPRASGSEGCHGAGRAGRCGRRGQVCPRRWRRPAVTAHNVFCCLPAAILDVHIFWLFGHYLRPPRRPTWSHCLSGPEASRAQPVDTRMYISNGLCTNDNCFFLERSLAGQ